MHQRHGADPARGRQWLTSPGTGLPLTVNGLSLKNAPASGSASAPATTTAATARSFHVTSWSTEQRTGTIADGAQSYLEVHQAASPGWTATLNGQRLTPVTLDGWQQAFIVPAGAGGQVVMTYTPASGYHLWLIIAIVAFAVLLVLACWPRRRRGQPHRFFWRHPASDPTNAAPAAETIPPADSDLRPPRPRDPPDPPRPPPPPRHDPAPHDPAEPPRPHDSAALHASGDITSPIPSASPGRTTSPSARWEPSSRAYWITVIAATVVLALVSGWLAFVVPAVLLVGWAVPRWVPWLAFLAMCVAGGFAIAELNHGPQSGFGAFGPAAQFAAIVALAAALISAPRLGRPTRTSRRPVRPAVQRPGSRAGGGPVTSRVSSVSVATRPGPSATATAGRLTAIEELDYLLERPAEPSLVLWEVHCHGHLDRAALAGAVTAAFEADSGACRRLAAAPRWGRYLYWRPVAPDPGGPLTATRWRTPADLDALRERLFAWPISLTEAVARVVLAVGPEHDVVIIQVHHTAFDGVSSLRLLNAITQAYRARATALNPHSVPDSPTSASRPADSLPPPNSLPESQPAPDTPPSLSHQPHQHHRPLRKHQQRRTGCAPKPAPAR